MKKLLILVLGLLVLSCTSKNPTYEENLTLAKNWVKAFETGNGRS
jgi:hypothetical protein